MTCIVWDVLAHGDFLPTSSSASVELNSETFVLKSGFWVGNYTFPLKGPSEKKDEGLQGGSVGKSVCLQA